MIFIRVRQNVPLRIAEWLCGLAMIGVGLYLVIWPEAFQRAGLSGFAAIAPASVWVAASLLIGAARLGALVLNGHNARLSAPVRCLVAVLGVGLFSSIAAGFAQATNELGPPLGIVLALVFMAGDFFNAARAGADTYSAFHEVRLSRSVRPWTGFTR